MTKNVRNVAAVVIALLCASFASATIVQTGPGVALQDLIDGTATITSGNLTFNSFGYAGTGEVPDATGVNVIPIEDCDGNVGVRFQGGFLDLPGNGASDALISYNVVAPGPLLTGAHLFANTQVSGSGGLAQITESFLPPFTDISLDVFDNGTVQQLADSVKFNTSADYAGPVSTLPVQKDILLLAADDGVSATISLVDQVYHQVPEPSALALILVGLVAFARRRR